MYLFVSLCIFLTRGKRYKKIHLDTTYLLVSLGPGGGRYKKIHLDMTYLFVSFAPRQEEYIKIHLDTS